MYPPHQDEGRIVRRPTWLSVLHRRAKHGLREINGLESWRALRDSDLW